MNELKITSHNGRQVIDSREVAEMVGKPHNDLMKSIRNYCEHLGQGNFSQSDFFIESTYKNAQNKTQPCYLLTKKGCDMIANKMTGAKGVLFTAAYVTAFENMREHICSNQLQQIDTQVQQIQAEAQLLSAKVQAAEQLIRMWESAGVAQSEQLLKLSEFYGVLAPKQPSSPRIHDASRIAIDLGLYTDIGHPHAQVVDAIVDTLISNPKLIADYDEDGRLYPIEIERDIDAWLRKNHYPAIIRLNTRTFYVSYKYQPQNFNPHSF